MIYFLEENLVIPQKKIKELKDFKTLNQYHKEIDLQNLHLVKKDFIYKSLMYYAIENNQLNLIKELLNNGYYIKTLINGSDYHFNDEINSYISHIGKYYNEDILKFILLEKNKIKLISILQSVFLNKNISIFNKIKAIFNINKSNNVLVNINKTEILQNLTESNNLEGIKSVYSIFGKIDYNEIFYYLTTLKGESTIDYIFSKDVKGSILYNNFALNSLVENTERFKKFYLRMGNPIIDGTLIDQIIESENIDLLYFFHNEDVLKLHYNETILEDIVFHSIFKNKIKSLKTLLLFWDYDFLEYFKIKKIYRKKVNIDIETFILNLLEKQQLKKRLENKLKKCPKDKIDKI